MTTLFDRLLIVARDLGYDPPRNKDIQQICGWKSSGRVSQIKEDGESAELGAGPLARLVGLGYSPAWITTGKGDKKSKHFTMEMETGHYSIRGNAVSVEHGAISIPRLAVEGSMGPGSEYPETDEVIERITLTGDWVRRSIPSAHINSLAIISGKGNSMEPTFKDGDLLLVDTAIRSVTIDGIYVLSAFNRLFIKSVRQRLDGIYEVSSDNPAIKTVDVLNGDGQIIVHGKVVMIWNGKTI